MFKRLKYLLLCFLLCASSAVQAQNTSGTDFWMAFIQNEDTDTLSTDFFYLRLFLSAQEATEVTVSNEKLGYEKKVSVAANSVEILTLPFHDFNMTEYGKVTNKSIHITSDNPISVYAENYQSASCDATLALPTTACGSYYIVQNNVSRTVSDNYFFLPSVFNVIAFEDNTEVEITPTLETSDGKPANQPFRITLNKGDVYQVCNKEEDMGKGLSGSQVLALDGKKIAVYTGNRCSNVPDSQITGDSDILFDVSYPVSSWGKKFIIRPFLEGNYDIIKCTAFKDGTKIYKDGKLLTTINALESFEFQIAETDGAIKIESTEPVSVYQYMTSSKYLITRPIGGPSFQYVTPIEQAIEEISFSTVLNIYIPTHYVNVVIRTEDVETSTLNGETGYATFTPVDDEYSSASVPIRFGQYTLKAEHGFIANVYGQGRYISYSYSAGSKIESINKEGEYAVGATTVSKPCGEGSKSCPFHIKTPGELLYFAAVINGNIDTIEVNEYANAILDDDLDLSRVCSPELGSWTPIGTGSSRFRGLFNGHNHTIKNLYINGSAEGLGLFGKVSNCEIRNLIIGHGLIKSSGPSVGSIVGVGVATIIDCHNYADIECASKFNGGIIGYASKDSYIEKCHNEGKIIGTSSQSDLFGVGGIAGALSRGTITDCYSLGSISGQSSRVGGIVGSAENCLITNCYSYGDVESKKNDHGGGICAIAEAYPNTKVEHSYYYNSLDKVGQQPQMQRPQSDFNDGTIFALLNEHTPNLWRQEEGKYPVFIDTVFNPISYQKRYVTICEGERYRFEGKDYSVSGTYLPSCSCDGDTLILTTLAGSKETVSLCKGDSVLFNGKYIKEAGTYIATTKQCGDTLVVDILSPSTYTLTKTINSDESYTFGRQILTKEGTYTDTIKGAAENGCDSIVTLQLKVTKCTVEGDELNVTICSGDTFSIGGKDFSKPGSYQVTLTSIKGCDSIITLNIKAARTDTVVVTDFIVNETHYEGYGFTVDVKLGTLNFFSKTFKNQVGCDSIVTLVLSSLTQPIPVYDTICKGETYTVNGETFSQTGDYKVVLGKYQGCDCDSSMMLHLFVAEPNETTFHDTVSIADGTYKKHGFNIERLKVGTNTYTETYKNQFGCDSVVSIVLNVTSHTVHGEAIYEEICENETFTYNDSTFKPGNTYTLRETTALGYDSLIELNIKSLPTSKSSYTATVELGDTYTKNGFDLPEQVIEGVFYHQLTTTNMYGCDSTVTLQLTVVTPKDSIIIPTLFTPHTREGKNDIFMEGYEVYIYDRYGNLVCHSKNGWDGYYRGKKADPGVYIYTLFLKDDRKKKGSIEIYK